jgi:pSer/pThr/pTyr-binding forkhead associated (FHA) protein
MKKDGTQMELELGERPITIGRSPEADVVILDEKASRLHCGIRLWDGEFYIKDLKSRNGTYVNGERVDVAKLKLGDKIRVGSIVFSFDADPSSHATAALQEVEDEIARGKGYSTILREIVSDLDQPAAANEAVATAKGEPPPEQPMRVKVRKPRTDTR